MPYRNITFVNGNYYHIFNRGVAKQVIFKEDKNYLRFLDTLNYYRYSGIKPKFSHRYRMKSFQLNTKKPLVEITAYCLMPNHFHLLVKQIENGGIEELITKLCDSYSMYFNIKNKRVGHLFQDTFKAVLVETDEQLLHLSRYIHLNPYVANLVENPTSYPWSSCQEYFENRKGICQKEIILNDFNKLSYPNFVTDHKDYAKQFHQIQHLFIE